MPSQDVFLDKMLGYHDITVNGGAALPRRHLINFIGAKLEDVGGLLRVSVTHEQSWPDPSVEITAQQDDFLPAGFPTLSDVAINPTGGTQVITGFDATGLKIFSKRIWNLSGDARNLQIFHANISSLADNRITTPDGLTLTLTPGQGARLVRNQSGTGWRVLPCLS